MFAVVRTGGKQYRVAAGDKIVVDKIDGDAGSRISLGDVLFASDGEMAGLSVAAEILAQAKADKVVVFKKKRRHNYRRKAGHRQQHTILKIVSVGTEDKQPVKVEAEAVAADAGADVAVPAVEKKASRKAPVSQTALPRAEQE